MSILCPDNLGFGNFALTGGAEIADGKITLTGEEYWSSLIMWNKCENTTSDVGPNFTAVGSPTYSAAKFNNGVNSASGKYVKFTPDTAINAACEKFSVCFWYKANGSIGAGHRFFSTDSGTGIRVQMYENSGTIRCWVSNGASTSEAYFSSALISGTNLYFIQFVFDNSATAKRVKCYLNGSDVTTTYSNNSITGAQFGGLFYVGNLQGTGYYINGTIDNWIMLNDSAALIPDQYNNEYPGTQGTTGTASIIFDMGEGWKPTTLSFEKTEPSGSTVTVETRNYYRAPTESVTGDVADDTYTDKLFDFYSDWGDTVPYSAVTATSGADLGIKERYVELLITLTLGSAVSSPTFDSLALGTIFNAFDVGEFEVSTISLSNAPENATLSVNATDTIAKFLDKTITTAEYAGTELLSAVIEDVLELCGITEHNITPTTATVIASGASTPLYKSTAAKTILNEIIERLQIEADYRLFVKDGVITLGVITTEYDCDYGITERDHMTSSSRNYDDDKRMSRITVLTQSNTEGAEVQLGAEASGSAAGTVTITSTDEAGQDYCFTSMRAVIVTTGDFEVVETARELSASGSPHTTIEFEVTGTSGTYTINVYGCPINTVSGYIAESAGDGLNLRNGRGQAVVVTNKLFKTDAQCKQFADWAYQYYDDVLFSANAECNAIPMLDLNDNVFLFGKKLLVNNISALQGIALKFDAETNTLKQSLTLLDNSQTLAPYVYDRNGGPGDNDFHYDKFFPWDWDLVSQSSDTNNYKPII